MAKITVRDMSGSYAAWLGVAEYQLVASLPQKFQTSLPSIEEIEAELSKENEKPPCLPQRNFENENSES